MKTLKVGLKKKGTHILERNENGDWYLDNRYCKSKQ